MTFKELLKRRRSIRNFQDREVPLDILKDIIKDCVLAPNSGNDQNWKFVIVQDKATMKRISNESKKNIVEYFRMHPEDHCVGRYDSLLRREGFNVFRNAPCLVFIFGKKGSRNLAEDCSLAASYLMMAATSRGLGTCWINWGKRPSIELQKTIGISSDYQIIAPIVIGYPEKIPEVTERKSPQILKIIGGQA